MSQRYTKEDKIKNIAAALLELLLTDEDLEYICTEIEKRIREKDLPPVKEGEGKI